MNVLRRGAVLSLPTDADLARVAPAEARAEVGRQYRAWSDQRGNGRLRLVPPSEAATQAGSGGGGTAGSASTGALQQRVNELEQQLAEKDRLLTLRSAELARLQQKGAAASSGGTTTRAPAPALTPTPAPTPAPVPTPAPTATPTVKAPMAAAPSAPAPEEPSLLDWLMERWYVPVAGLALLVAAAIALRVRRSRQDGYGDRHFDQFGGSSAGTLVGESSQTLPARQLPDTDSIVVEETGSHRHDGGTGAAPTPTIAVSDDGSSAAAELPAAAGEGAGVGLDQGDPLAEADFHMAYGLYDQAAELVNQAIAREPERRELKLKLLEVYFVWGNKQKFEELAGELSRRRDDAVPGEWEKIVIMGRQIAPDNALFSNPANIAGAAAGSVDLNLEGGQNRVDFNLMGEPSISSGHGEGIDLDLGEALADLPGVEAGARPPGESGVDFLLDTPVRGESGELYT
jgi:pilus assembly protein FimV